MRKLAVPGKFACSVVLLGVLLSCATDDHRLGTGVASAQRDELTPSPLRIPRSLEGVVQRAGELPLAQALVASPADGPRLAFLAKGDFDSGEKWVSATGTILRVHDGRLRRWRSSDGISRTLHFNDDELSKWEGGLLKLPPGHSEASVEIVERRPDGSERKRSGQLRRKAAELLLAATHASVEVVLSVSETVRWDDGGPIAEWTSWYRPANRALLYFGWSEGGISELQFELAKAPTYRVSESRETSGTP